VVKKVKKKKKKVDYLGKEASLAATKCDAPTPGSNIHMI